ncbi:MAG TPA: hypothetical protein VGG92_06335 [Caulobacteraceae bacterium]|jgi:hypothetical protein
MTSPYEAVRLDSHARTVVIQPRAGLRNIDLPEVWRYRDLLYVLAIFRRLGRRTRSGISRARLPNPGAANQTAEAD